MAIRAYWSPASEFVSLRDAMDRLVADSFINPRSLLGAAGGVGAVPANLFETPEGFIVQLAVSGLDSEKVEITMKGATVQVKGERSAPRFEQAQQIWSGIGQGAFDHTFTLPTAVDSEGASADYDQGLLTLRLPKVRSARAHTVKVTSAPARPVIEEKVKSAN
ncbi:MAG TPA: Hsp20/alpha crystallin family protein [Chloroflexota bacterium]|nr:Hsp20/alpha crystallin family protein [Chloroflexota bacterium]